jgi:hypothetical protein
MWSWVTLRIVFGVVIDFHLQIIEVLHVSINHAQKNKAPDKEDEKIPAESLAGPVHLVALLASADVVFRTPMAACLHN